MRPLRLPEWQVGMALGRGGATASQTGHVSVVARSRRNQKAEDTGMLSDAPARLTKPCHTRRMRRGGLLVIFGIRVLGVGVAAALAFLLAQALCPQALPLSGTFAVQATMGERQDLQSLAWDRPAAIDAEAV